MSIPLSSDRFVLVTAFVLTLPDSGPGDVIVVGSSHIIDADTIIVSNETGRLASSDAPNSTGRTPAGEATAAASRQRLYSGPDVQEKEHAE